MKFDSVKWKNCKIILLILTILVSIPLMLELKAVGLDPSWRFAINKFFDEGYIYGKDIVSTYGPLGFIVYCNNIGHNILISVLIWLFILVCHVTLLYQLLFKDLEQRRHNGVLISILIYILTFSLVLHEYYIAYLAVFSFLLMLKGYKKNIYIFNAMFLLAFLTKFSLFIMVFTVMLIYFLLGVFYKKDLYRYYSIRLFLGIFLLPCFYFVIEGVSLSNFWNYIKGGIELSSGYSSAMSIDTAYTGYILWVIVAALIYIICVCMSLKSGIYNFIVFSVNGLCLFMCYKHGFVRADGHVIGGINSMLPFLCLLLAFLDWESIFSVVGKYKSIYISLMSIIVSIAMIFSGFSVSDIVTNIKRKVIDIPYTVAQLGSQDDSVIDVLPERFLSTIGDATVSIYPWEISYCISNDLNYVPLYGIQAYSTYTPYLDKKTAENLLNQNSPEYIVFSKDTIDNRWPFIECPQTWEVIRNNYYIEVQEGDLFLLKHYETDRTIDYTMQGSEMVPKDNMILLNGCDYLKIRTKLNILGKLAKTFWKISAVNMHVYYEDGTEITKRVLLDMFSGGVELGRLVNDNDTLIDVLNDTGDLARVDKICFEGAGLKYYQNDIEIQYFSTSELYKESLDSNIKTNYLLPIDNEDFSSYKIEKNSVQCYVDSDKKTNYFEKIEGWAYIDKTKDNGSGKICIEYDGKYYQCDIMTREDVKNAYNLLTDQVGFSGLIKRSDANAQCRICIIDVDNKVIYK